MLVNIPATRKEAHSLGSNEYWTGIPCKSGHIAFRTVWRSNCRECERESKLRRADKIAEWQRAYRSRNTEKRRAYSRHVEQKLPLPSHAAPATCECCGGTSAKALSLDHCHNTNSFRGWLCERCNLSIGGLGDDLEGLLRAVAYLQKGRN